MVTLIDFYAEWCGPCDRQDPVVEEIDEEFDEVTVEKVDIEEDAARANEYNVQSIPTLVIQDGDRVLERFIGFTPKTDIAGVIEENAS